MTPLSSEATDMLLHLLDDVEREMDDRARFTYEGGPEAPADVAFYGEGIQ